MEGNFLHRIKKFRIANKCIIIRKQQEVAVMRNNGTTARNKVAIMRDKVAIMRN